MIKYADEKMAEHAKQKLSLLDFGSNGGRLEVEFLKASVAAVAAVAASRTTAQPAKPILKGSLSLIETCSGKSCNELKSSIKETKTEIPKKFKDFSLASILGLPSKIESPLSVETAPELAETPAKTRAPVVQPSKPVDPRLQKREQAGKQAGDLNELLKTCHTPSMSSEPKKKITVLSLECEKPTTKEAMRIVLNQFNNLIDVMMYSTGKLPTQRLYRDLSDLTLTLTLTLTFQI